MVGELKNATDRDVYVMDYNFVADDIKKDQLGMAATNNKDLAENNF